MGLTISLVSFEVQYYSFLQVEFPS